MLTLRGPRRGTLPAQAAQRGEAEARAEKEQALREAAEASLASAEARPPPATRSSSLAAQYVTEELSS